MATRPKSCPCHSGRRYAECCEHRHDGTQPAETPEALMRSRFSAFALGLGEYLVETLAANHPDRAAPRDVLARELSRARDTQRFLGLRIIHAATAGNRGEVLFHARIFERGENRSFAELSTFTREDGRWRYASGELLPHDALPCAPDELTLEAFRAALGTH
jgi:SEC-C motif-containing protein